MSASINDKITDTQLTVDPVTTTVSVTRSGGAGSMTIADPTGWPTASAIHFMTYTVDVNNNKVAGSQINWKATRSGSVLGNLTRTGGATDNGNSIGDIAQMGPTAAWGQDLADGFGAEHNQLDGTHTAITATSITATTGTFTNLTIAGTASAEGWSALGATPNTVTANGNRSYDLVFNANDLTDTITEGMRVRTARTVAAPIQCTSLNGTTQYYSKASPNKMTFTDDFVVSAWVKLSSYPTADGSIASRYNGTSGWDFAVLSTGQVQMVGFNAGAANFNAVFSYQSIPLNKWVHLTAQLDMSTAGVSTTTSYIMIDGVDVPANKTTGGTNPTALVQAGSLEIGSRNAGTKFFPGKIAQVAIYSAKVTQATILASMNQKLAGTETNLASAYSFSNSITDLNTTTPNDLTANGSAVATNTDSPFGNSGVSTTLDYGIVMKKAFSTNTTLTIQVPEGCTIPTSGGVSSMDYSTQSVPYGFPRSKKKWTLELVQKSRIQTNSPVNGTWYNANIVPVPTGSWTGYWSCNLYVDKGTAASLSVYGTFSTGNNTESEPLHTGSVDNGSTLTSASATVTRPIIVEPTTLTLWYFNYKTSASSMAAIYNLADVVPTIIRLENAYL